MNTVSEPNVIRVSIGWFAIGAALVLLLGMAGGLLASQIWPPSVPLITERERVIPAVQEVTVSSDKASASALEQVNRSIVHLATREGERLSVLATGVVLTNDGVVATTADFGSREVVAIDYQGVPIPLDSIGADILYGLRYYKLRSGVLTPLDIRTERVPVAWVLLLAERSAVSPLPAAASVTVQEYVLPPDKAALGIRRLLRSALPAREVARGAPLVDNDGRLAGLVYDPAAGLVLPFEHVRESLQRLAAQERERNPFAEYGFSPTYRFAALEEGAPQRFVMEVRSLIPVSPARQAGLRAGDIILAISGQDLAWETDAAVLLQQPQPILLQVQRAGRTTEVSLARQPSPSS